MEYEWIRSERKTISLEVKDGKILVRSPKGVSRRQIEEFLQSHRRWIGNRLSAQQALNALQPLSHGELQKLMEQAREVIPQRVAYYAPLVGVSYGRITIRCQKTRWGSCSAQGNLNFNCLLMLAPPEVLDSVVVHELCHRKQMNHSQRFYEEVLKVYPQYHIHHNWLKTNGAALLARVPRDI